MSDQRIRELERQAAAGDPDAAAALARERRAATWNPPRYWLVGEAKDPAPWRAKRRTPPVRHLVGAVVDPKDTRRGSAAGGWGIRGGPLYEWDKRDTTGLCGVALEGVRWRPQVGDDVHLWEGIRLCKRCQRAWEKDRDTVWVWQVAWAHDTLHYPYPLEAREAWVDQIETALSLAERKLVEVGLWVLINRYPSGEGWCR